MKDYQREHLMSEVLPLWEEEAAVSGGVIDFAQYLEEYSYIADLYESLCSDFDVEPKKGP